MINLNVTLYFEKESYVMNLISSKCEIITDNTGDEIYTWLFVKLTTIGISLSCHTNSKH